MLTDRGTERDHIQGSSCRWHGSRCADRADSRSMLIPDVGSRVWAQVEHRGECRPRCHAHLTSERPGLLCPAAKANRLQRASTSRSCLINRQTRLFVTGPAVWLRGPRARGRGASPTTQALPRRHQRAVHVSPSSATRTERRRRRQGPSRQPSAAAILRNRKAAAAEPASAAASSEQQCVPGALSRRIIRAPSPCGAEPEDWISEPRRRRPARRRRRLGTRTRYQRREQTGVAAATAIPVRCEQPRPAPSSIIGVGE